MAHNHGDYVLLSTEVLNDVHIQTLPPAIFRSQLESAVRGQPTVFDKYIRRRILNLEAWRNLRAAVFRRDGYTCVYCREKGGPLECDHIIPRSRGGTNTKENLATACRRCNRSKKNLLLEQWRGKR